MSDAELKELAPFPWKSYKIRRPSPHLYRLVDEQDLTVLLVPGKEGTGTGDRAREIAEYVLRAANSHEELLNLRAIAIDIEACLRSGAPVPEFMQFAFSDAITATERAKAKGARHDRRS